MAVIGHAQINIIDSAEEIARCQSPAGKPFIRVTLPDGQVFNFTLNFLAMLGGAATGAISRFGLDKTPTPPSTSTH